MTRGVVFAGLAVAAVLLTPGTARPQFTSARQDSHVILEGNWQSCRGSDGSYSERVYDHVVNGVGRFEVHLGPRNEFAIFEQVQDEHRDHNSAMNLLKPYRVPLDSLRATQSWKIPALALTFGVARAGEFRGDCESWFIKLAPIDKTSE